MARRSAQHRALRTGQVTRAVLTNRSVAGARGQPIGEQWSAGVRLPRREPLSTDSTHTLHFTNTTDGTPLNKYLILGKSRRVTMGREDYNLSLIVGSVYLTVLRNCTETRHGPG